MERLEARRGQAGRGRLAPQQAVRPVGGAGAPPPLGEGRRGRRAERLKEARRRQAGQGRLASQQAASSVGEAGAVQLTAELGGLRAARWMAAPRRPGGREQAIAPVVGAGQAGAQCAAAPRVRPADVVASAVQREPHQGAARREAPHAA
ncbi:hypothetical protein GCM10019059_26880 [Camelimonas fluminis]|uniref:Uncharacterized protein n=1 Tax=Camelimonas fluminis TaxID=1576911 RepID=A0ABV7UNP5_9HYPH|nr:hypothetical protein [Camelimonas fluminis]GHE65709.1 hypothetical protein GCM10019059_26880 [Camelimonas fluminis]